MKSYIRAFTITVVLNLIPAGSATAQTGSANESRPTASELLVEDLAARPDDALLGLMKILNAKSQQSGGGKVLVIPTAEALKTQDLVTIIEDTTVMCHILDKKLGQYDLTPRNSLFSGGGSRSRTSWSNPFSRDGRSTRATYVQGYGILFLAKVDIPLSPPPSTAQQEKLAEGRDSDPLWAQTRQEIYAPEQANERRKNGPKALYDAQEVETFKKTIVEALKHATNIRSLKPGESVILTVIGSGVSSGIKSIRAIPDTDQLLVIDGKNITRVYKGAVPSEIVISAPTVLTIRAKKSDIDSFAKGNLDLEKFRQHVQVISYPYLEGS